MGLTREPAFPHIVRLESWEVASRGQVSPRRASAPATPSKGCECMPLVKVKENESIDKAIRRFKKKCEKEGIIQDIKKSSRYLKPSERKRKKALKAAKRRRSGKG